MIPIGSVVAGYRVRRVVGTGGMGAVYAVDDPQLPRLDALKVLSAELSADPKFRARFIREADVASRLDHPNIVSIYDRGETPDHQLWIAMQLVDGTDADAAIRAGTMTPRRAVHIITQVADALDHAHARHVLHRDIKPANFLLTGAVGPEERALLADFGIARAVDDAGLTGTNMVMATMAYAAPEVLNGGQIDYRADLYSLGCALFHLLTGEVPYADTTGASAQAMAHLRRPPPQLSAITPGLGPAFDAVITTAMAKDPADRYPSGRALAAAARAALQHRDHTTSPVAVGLHSGSTHPPTGAAAPARRRRGRLIGVGVAAALLVAGGATAAVVMSGNDNPAGPAAVGATDQANAVPTVAADQLPGLLLSIEQIGAAVGGPAKSPFEPWTEFSKDSTESCTATVYPLQRSAYASSGATDTYGQELTETTGKNRTVAIQSVVAFPSADLAARYVDRQRSLWQQCAYKAVAMKASGDKPAFNWRIGEIGKGDVVTTTATSDTTNRTYQHALTSANNVVVDVFAYVGDKADAAQTIAQGIAEKIPN